MSAIEFLGRGEPRTAVTLIGLPWDGGASLGAPGGRYGPEAIRRALGWWMDRIREDRVWDVESDTVIDVSGLRLRDGGDVEIAGHDPEATFERATAAVADAIAAGEVPVVLGGDHSISIPAVRGLAAHAGRIGIVQLDAHLDLVDDSPLQGRLSQSSPMRRSLELDAMSPERLVQIGLRSFNYPEYREWCRAKGIVQVTAPKAIEMGADAVAAAALGAAGDGDAAIYLTVDLDALDPGIAPGVGHMEPGGLPFAFVSRVVRALAPRAAAFDIAELNPMRDSDSATASVAARLVLDFVFARAAADAAAARCHAA